MKTCTLNDFLETVRPWIDNANIRNAYLHSDGNFVLNFTDGVKNTYQITDCNAGQLEGVLNELKEKGIPVKRRYPLSC
jgi:hypothetical protein